MANRNRFRKDWFSDGSYFSENGETIHTIDGTPLCYFDEITNTFHRYSDGAVIFYYDMFGEQLIWHMINNERQCNRW